MEIAAEVSTLKYCFENFLEDKQGTTPNTSDDGNLVDNTQTNPSHYNITSNISENNYNQIVRHLIVNSHCKVSSWNSRCFIRRRLSRI